MMNRLMKKPNVLRHFRFIATTPQLFESTVLKPSQTSPVLVDFYATWCGPCRMLAPVLDQVTRQSNVTLVKVDVDESPDVAASYQVSSLPTVMLFSKGKSVASFVGARDAAFCKQFLENHTSQ